MKRKYNFLIAAICMGIFVFEMILFRDIFHHPYIVGLIIFICCTGGYHFGIGVSKLISKKP